NQYSGCTLPLKERSILCWWPSARRARKPIVELRSQVLPFVTGDFARTSRMIVTSFVSPADNEKFVGRISIQEHEPEAPVISTGSRSLLTTESVCTDLLVSTIEPRFKGCRRSLPRAHAA